MSIPIRAPRGAECGPEE